MNKIKAEDLIRQDIAALDPYTPGIYYTELAARLGRAPEKIIKLDANENPYGPPPAALRALAELTTPHRYPDPAYRELRGALADFTGAPVEQILAGAGSDELLALTTHLLLEPGDAVITCPPTFAMYGFFARLAGARVIEAPRKADLTLDLAAVEAAVMEHRPKLCFICAPNNPTGDTITAAALTRLLALPCIILLDEAYVEFAAHASRIDWAPDHENLIVLRTFSKWGGLAGLRAGYGAFPAAMMPHLWKIKEPYAVSAAAEAAARAALADVATLNARRDTLVAERARLTAALREMPWLDPYPSQANFVLCRVVGRDPAALRAALEAQGILLRWYTKPSMAGLVRITVGTPEQNTALIAALGSAKA